MPPIWVAEKAGIKDAANNLAAALQARHGARYRVTVDDECGFVLIMQLDGAQ